MANVLAIGMPHVDCLVSETVEHYHEERPHQSLGNEPPVNRQTTETPSSDTDETKLVHALIEVPRLMTQALALEPQIEKLARDIAKSQDVLYLGRGTNYPLALEGALKLKEISYIHAEGYAAGELKHGPIALIDEKMPVVVIAPYDRVFEKTVSNMQEVAARGGRIILMTDAQGARDATVESLVTIILPDMPATVTPLVYAIPVQMLAYHTAVEIGRASCRERVSSPV